MPELSLLADDLRAAQANYDAALAEIDTARIAVRDAMQKLNTAITRREPSDPLADELTSVTEALTALATVEQTYGMAATTPVKGRT